MMKINIKIMNKVPKPTTMAKLIAFSHFKLRDSANPDRNPHSCERSGGLLPSGVCHLSNFSFHSMIFPSFSCTANPAVACWVLSVEMDDWKIFQIPENFPELSACGRTWHNKQRAKRWTICCQTKHGGWVWVMQEMKMNGIVHCSPTTVHVCFPVQFCMHQTLGCEWSCQP